jgi:NAD(P)-dependent dehydrogenase (short-subunit alcohol dehydrogenase family)
MSGVMVVTGGSRGIGAATARLAATRGYDVAINYRTRQAAAEAVAADAARAQVRAIAVQGDVAKESDVVRLFEKVAAGLGRPTALVNNAGTVGTVGRVEDLDASELKTVFELNVIGCFLCAREAIRRMSTRHGGRGGGIVNVSSIAARLGSANMWVHYAASKAAIDTFTFGLAREVGPDGIRVNAVAPGLIDTEIHEAAGGSERYPPIVQDTPLGRVGTPEDVAETILWLLSDAASFVTGTVVEVSGGR